MSLFQRLRAGLRGSSPSGAASDSALARPSDTTSMAGLREALERVRLQIHAAEDVLPTWASVTCLALADQLQVALSSDLDSGLRLSAASLVHSHLPDTLDVARRAFTVHEGVDEDNLFRQISVLRSAADSLLEGVRDRGARELAVQERFLVDRYETTDLLGGQP
jgi:hypothetical protein